MLTRSVLLHLAKEYGRRFHEMVVSSAVKLIFTKTAMITQPRAKSMTTKANRASHGPRVLAKERTRQVSETGNPMDKSRGTQSAKGAYKGKNSKS